MFSLKGKLTCSEQRYLHAAEEERLLHLEGVF